MNKFNVKFSDSTYRAVATLAEKLEVSMADVIREALSLYWWAGKECMAGSRLLIQRGSEITELVIPSLEQLKQGPEYARELVKTEVTLPPAANADHVERQGIRGRPRHAADAPMGLAEEARRFGSAR